MFAGQLILAGFVNGAIYSLIAVGLVVIYKASRVLNFGHGHMCALAAFISFSLLNEYGLPWSVAIFVSMAVTVVVALVTVALVVRPLRGERPLTIVVATLGVALILGGVIQAGWGPSPKLYPPMLKGTAFTAFGLNVTAMQALMVGFTLVVVGAIAAFFRFTRVGIAMRAASENPMVSELLGINIRSVSIASWGLGGALGALAAILVSPQISLTPDAHSGVMIQAFGAVVIAGFTNILGAVVGGFITGIALNLFAGYVVSDMPNTFLLLLLLVVLLLRPHGLFGTAESLHL